MKIITPWRFWKLQFPKVCQPNFSRLIQRKLRKKIYIETTYNRIIFSQKVCFQQSRAPWFLVDHLGLHPLAAWKGSRGGPKKPVVFLGRNHISSPRNSKKHAVMRKKKTTQITSNYKPSFYGYPWVILGAQIDLSQSEMNIKKTNNTTGTRKICSWKFFLFNAAAVAYSILTCPNSMETKSCWSFVEDVHHSLPSTSLYF